jgi:hypothetical protein
MNVSERNEMVHRELIQRGYRDYWTVEGPATRVTYWAVAAGENTKSILLVEHATRRTGESKKWDGWDIFNQLTPDNDPIKTLQALDAYTAHPTAVHAL